MRGRVEGVATLLLGGSNVLPQLTLGLSKVATVPILF